MSPARPLGAPRVRVSCVDVPPELLADGVGLSLTLRGGGPGGTPSMLHTCSLAKYTPMSSRHGIVNCSPHALSKALHFRG